MNKTLLVVLALLLLPAGHATIENVTVWFTGENALDSTGNYNIGGASGLQAGITASNCRIGNCWLWAANATTTGSQIGQSALNGATAGTINFWARETALTAQGHVFSRSNGTIGIRGQYGAYTGNDDAMGFELASSTLFAPPSSPGSDTMVAGLTMYTFVWNSTNKYIYVNGTLNNSVAAAQKILTTGTLYFGQNGVNTNNRMTGTVDEWSLWNMTVLNSTDVQCLWNSGTGVTYSNLNSTCGAALPPSGNFTITAKDNNTAVNLQTFNATITTYPAYSLLVLQEFANVSVGNGTFDTGTYGVSGTGGFNGAYYTNYTKPLDAQNAIWQIKIGSNATLNVSVPDACMSQSPLQFRMNSIDTGIGNSVARGACWNGTSYQTLTDNTGSAFSGGGGSANCGDPELWRDGDYSTASLNTLSTGSCDWPTLGFASQALYEEAIWWNITSTRTYTTTTGEIETDILVSPSTNMNITVEAPFYLPTYHINLASSTGSLESFLEPYTNITVADFNLGTGINSAVVTYEGTNYTADTSGHVSLPVNTSTYDILASATNYIARLFQGLLQQTAYTARLYQAQVNFNASNIVTGSPVTGFTASNGSISNTTTPALMYLRAGTYNFTFQKSGYFDTYKVQTIAAQSNDTVEFLVYDAVINVTAKDLFTNTTITTFSAAATLGDHNELETTTNGEAHIPWTQTSGTLVEINATGYAMASELFDVPVPGYNNITFFLAPANSLAINIYDQNTLALLSGTAVTVTISNGTFSESNTTSTGTLFTILTPGTYDVVLNATGYSTAIYAVTINPDTTQTLDAYLVNSNTFVDFTTLDDLNAQPIQGALWTIQRVLAGNFTTVSSQYTDISGMIRFAYVPQVEYRFIVNATGYDPLIFLLNPIIQSAYTVRLTRTDEFNSSQDYSRISLLVNGPPFVNEQQNTVTMDIFSPYGELDNYNLTVIYPISASTYDTITTTGNNPNGSVLTIAFNISTSAILDDVTVLYGYESQVSGIHNFRGVYQIQNITRTGLFTNLGDNTYGLGALERIVLVTILTLGVAGLITPFLGPVVGGVGGLAVLLFFTATGFMPIWATVISILSGFALLTWGSGRQ